MVLRSCRLRISVAPFPRQGAASRQQASSTSIKRQRGFLIRSSSGEFEKLTICTTKWSGVGSNNRTGIEFSRLSAARYSFGRGFGIVELRPRLASVASHLVDLAVNAKMPPRRLVVTFYHRKGTFGRSFLVLTEKCEFGDLEIQPPSLLLTVSLTIRPSAFLPARRVIAAFITAPMSFIEVAPVSLIASLTACSISA